MGEDKFHKWIQDENWKKRAVIARRLSNCVHSFHLRLPIGHSNLVCLLLLCQWKKMVNIRCHVIWLKLHSTNRRIFWLKYGALCSFPLARTKVTHSPTPSATSGSSEHTIGFSSGNVSKRNESQLHICCSCSVSLQMAYAGASFSIFNLTWIRYEFSTRIWFKCTQFRLMIILLCISSVISYKMRNVYDGIVEAHVQIYYSVTFIKHVSHT